MGDAGRGGGIGARGVLMILLAFGSCAPHGTPTLRGRASTARWAPEYAPQGRVLLGVAAAGVLPTASTAPPARYAQI